MIALAAEVDPAVAFNEGAGIGHFATQLSLSIITLLLISLLSAALFAVVKQYREDNDKAQALIRLLKIMIGVGVVLVFFAMLK